MTPKSIVENADCLAKMRQMPDNAFDLAICDPPYGFDYLNSGGRDTNCTNPKHNRKYFERKKWDVNPPRDEYFLELYRVSVNQIVWGANYFVQYLTPSMGWIVWDKGQHGLTMSDGELAYSSFDKALRCVVINRGVLMQEGGTIHPTQKPVALYKWLLQNYAKPGDTILDTHLGSGSSRIAAYDLGFDFTGYELDKDYFEAQEKRFADHIAQAKLFDAPVLETVEQNNLF